MPTYTCTTTAGLLGPEQKKAVARAVTLAHAEVTGAPVQFAQVIFDSVSAGDHFIGGAAPSHDHLFLYGRIRAGRSASIRARLVERLTADVAMAAGMDRFGVWVYLIELPAAAMVEFGHVLPEAGQESAWIEALPAGDRARLLAMQDRWRR